MPKFTVKQSFYTDSQGTRLRGDIFEAEENEEIAGLVSNGTILAGEHDLTNVEAQTSVAQPTNEGVQAPKEGEVESLAQQQARAKAQKQVQAEEAQAQAEQQAAAKAKATRKANDSE